jgi:MFS family permease
MKADQPATSLANRTYVGLLVAQFLAAFNDQAIHASAMFFAINEKAMSDAAAISLMPILFYAPWALFCTIAGYLADRFSKRHTLVFWKFAEVAICGVALVGFWLGEGDNRQLVGGYNAGPFVVLACVFLMGTHSAFFVPAKYGVMPEILPPHLLSKGNGVLESLSFFAVILGTVCGGVMSFLFRERESMIGIVLLTLAVVGAVASLSISTMPAANPHRPFPAYVYGPLWESLRGLFRSRPLALAVVGLAFFTFIVAFMRATVYKLGESQNPRWDEFKTSLVVGAVAVGIALGSPLAGWFSGRKVELGLVPLGGLGMVTMSALAALLLDWVPGLVVSIMLIGFFTGFYIVPLFTLQQHRAPKSGKGDVIATSNFINVTGAILASLLFFGVVQVAQRTGLVPREEPRDNFAVGTLAALKAEFGRPVYFEVRGADGRLTSGGTPPAKDLSFGRLLARTFGRDPAQAATNQVVDVANGAEVGREVVVSTYTLRGVTHYRVREAGRRLPPAFDEQHLPRYLFLGASAMTLVTLLILWRQLPDLPARSWWWLRTFGRGRVRVEGLGRLPGTGHIILATDNLDDAGRGHLRAAVDRYTVFVAPKATESELRHAAEALRQGDVVSVALRDGDSADEAEGCLRRLRDDREVTLLPVYFGVNGTPHDVRLAFGEPLAAEASAEEIRRAIRRAAQPADEAEEH